jgi:hypothetical protein
MQCCSTRVKRRTAARLEGWHESRLVSEISIASRWWFNKIVNVYGKRPIRFSEEPSGETERIRSYTLLDEDPSIARDAEPPYAPLQTCDTWSRRRAVTCQFTCSLANQRHLTNGKLFVEKIHLLNTIMPPLSVI